ncbi:MAG: hypothetical protein SFU83_18975 [Meiothermus sp.]|nr:hypothetical protein [Meiothermus sp.]
MKLDEWNRIARKSVILSLSLALGYLLVFELQASGSGRFVLTEAIRNDLQIAGTVALIVCAVGAAVTWLFAQANLDELL